MKEKLPLLKQITKKEGGVFILDPYYSVDGLFELVNFLETVDIEDGKDSFSGNMLHVTRKMKDVEIDSELIKKIQNTNNSYQLKGTYGDSDTFLEIEKKIKLIKDKFNLKD